MTSRFDADMRAKYPHALMTHDFLVYRWQKWISMALVLTPTTIEFIRIHKAWTGKIKMFTNEFNRDLRDITAVQSMRKDLILEASITYSTVQDFLRTEAPDPMSEDYSPLEEASRRAEEARGFLDSLEQRTGSSSTVSRAITHSDIATQLEKLAELRQEGALSENEWTRAKELFLGQPPDKKLEAVTLLRNLHQLHQSGVLSEGEFNLKKWDILSRNQV